MRKLALWAVLLGGCATTGASGANVPNLPLQDLEGRTQYLGDYIGQQKVVVMSFWATWCQPCRQELVVLEGLYRKHKNELEILAVNTDGPETQSGVRGYVRQYGWSFPVLLDTDTRLAALYNPRKQMPMMIIFGRDGRVIYKHTTFEPGEASALRAKIRALLREEAGSPASSGGGAGGED